MIHKSRLLSLRLSGILRKKGFTLAAAESCSGGLFSSLITDTPGASGYFLLGVVAYGSLQKKRLLKIPGTTLEKYSPVSPQAASLMAKNIKKIAGADIGISLTGYAGPSGGTKKDPKGTVYIAISFKGKTRVKKYLFKGTRTAVKEKAVYQALKMLDNILVER